MSVAMLFPGQGAQHTGFLRALPDIPAVKETISQASEAVGCDVLSLDSEETLISTVNVQLTLVVAAACFARFCSEAQVEPTAVAGISVGSYGAAIAAGSIALTDALLLVRKRAELMETTFPAGTHGMAVLEGLRLPAVRLLLQDTDLTLANYNSEAQHVVAGRVDALQSLVERSMDAGARSAKLLRMGVASHTPDLLDAAKQLNVLAEQIPIQTPRVPLYRNRDARPLTTADGVREELAFNMAYPVRWHDIVTALGGTGVTVMLEAPPGSSLKQLVSHTLPDMPCFSAEAARWDVLLRAARRGY